MLVIAPAGSPLSGSHGQWSSWCRKHAYPGITEIYLPHGSNGRHAQELSELSILSSDTCVLVGRSPSALVLLKTDTYICLSDRLGVSEAARPSPDVPLQQLMCVVSRDVQLLKSSHDAHD